MAKTIRKISGAKMLHIHQGSLHNWSNRKLKLHAKLFRANHLIYSIRDTENRYIYSEFSVTQRAYPLLGTIIVDTLRGKVLLITRKQMVKAANSKTGSYPSLDASVSFNTESKLSLIWNVIKLLVK